jgi:hypothetical protein
MSTPEGDKLVVLFETKLGDLQDLCEGLHEKEASRAPTGRWSPKEILSHMLGPDGNKIMASVEMFIDKDVPLIEIETGNSYFTKERQEMSWKQLLTEVEQQYVQIAMYVSKLGPEQLSRKAHIPMLKDTPIGEYPTLTQWVEALAGHLENHVNHMKEVLGELAKL